MAQHQLSEVNMRDSWASVWVVVLAATWVGKISRVSTRSPE